MKMNNCPVCEGNKMVKKKYNSSNSKLSLKKIKYMIKSVFKEKNLFIGNALVCEHCGYGIMETIPNQEMLKCYYENQYWEQKLFDTTEMADKYKEDLRAGAQIKAVCNYLTDAKNILEIGAGSAFASLQLRDALLENNLELHVCEPGKQWVDYYIKNNIKKIAEYFPFNTELKFDYIHTSHWLEHVRDVKKTISVLNNMLTEKGYLFVEVPNTEFDFWELNRDRTPHIHFFTKKSLMNIFQQLGFECVFIYETGATRSEYSKTRVIPPEKYDGEHEKGCWIRSLFVKRNNMFKSTNAKY